MRAACQRIRAHVRALIFLQDDVAEPFRHAVPGHHRARDIADFGEVIGSTGREVLKYDPLGGTPP